MNQLLGIVDDKIVIEKLRLKYLEGNVMHVGNLDIKGSVNVNQTVNLSSNLSVNGTIEADTLKVKNLITEGANQLDAFTFSSKDSKHLDGKGLLWGLPDYTAQLIFKADPQRILSTESIDLRRNARYLIDGTDVLSQDRLGNAVLHSNLRSVGILEQLNVEGNVNLGNVLFVNSYLDRIGINIEKPNAAFSVVENSIEVVVGTNNHNRAVIGTWSSQGLDLITDNTTRVSIQGNHVIFGSEKSKNSVVKINGSLEVDTIISDTRVQRTSPIEFLEDPDSGVYNKGLLWKGKNIAKQLILVAGPDRFYSSENIDLASNKSFSISSQEVLSRDSLGTSVINSSLQTVGVLQYLNVGGNVNFNESLKVVDRSVIVNQQLTVANQNDLLVLTDSRINTSNNIFKIQVQDVQEFAVSNNSISIGNKENTSKIINAYGNLSINTTNPQPDAALTVNGNVVVNGRKFTDGDSVPLSGNWNRGDIVWNNNPQETSYVGWVCTMAGTPGTWKPFGYIGAK